MASHLLDLARSTYHSIKAGLQPRGVLREINGEMFRVDHRFFLSPAIDPEVADFMRARVGATDTCFNVGANVGLYPLQWSRWSKGLMYAFEPNPAALGTLRTHLRLNRITNVPIVEAAVGRQEGIATLYAAGSDGMARLEEPNVLIRHAVRPVTVSVLTLDEFCRRENVTPDWLIMDIEGFEVAALSGAKPLLQSKVKMIIEFHPGIWPKSDNASREEMESILQEHGLEAVPLSGQGLFVEHARVFLGPRSS